MVCRNWVSTGKCDKRDSCPYLHLQELRRDARRQDLIPDTTTTISIPAPYAAVAVADFPPMAAVAVSSRDGPPQKNHRCEGGRSRSAAQAGRVRGVRAAADLGDVRGRNRDAAIGRFGAFASGNGGSLTPRYTNSGKCAHRNFGSGRRRVAEWSEGVDPESMVQKSAGSSPPGSAVGVNSKKSFTREEVQCILDKALARCDNLLFVIDSLRQEVEQMRTERTHAEKDGAAKKAHVFGSWSSTDSESASVASSGGYPATAHSALKTFQIGPGAHQKVVLPPQRQQRRCWGAMS